MSDQIIYETYKSLPIKIQIMSWGYVAKVYSDDKYNKQLMKIEQPYNTYRNPKMRLDNLVREQINIYLKGLK